MLNFRTRIENTGNINTSFGTKRGYEECTSFMLYDKTGDYSLINPGGWGFPNITRASVVTLNLIAFDPVTMLVFKPTPPPINLVGSSFFTAPNYELELTYNYITGGAQNGNLPNGLYGFVIAGTQGATPLYSAQVAIQPCEIVCELNRLADKILYTNACCETKEKYELLSDTFMALNYELDCINDYFKTIDPTTEDFSAMIFDKSVYEKLVLLYEKSMALVGKEGGCGCGC